MAINKLTDREIRQAKPRDKPYKLSDGDGLFVLIHPNGSKYFRLKYRIDGKEKSYAIGVYPEVSLSDARQEAYRARELIREGNDPVVERKLQKWQRLKERQNTFRSVAEDWIMDNKIDWSEGYLGDIRRMMKNHIFPHLGEKRIKEIRNIDVINLLNLTKQQGKADTTKRIRQTCERVFRYGGVKEICENNPAANVRDVFRNKNYIKQHYHSLQFSEIPRFYSDIEKSGLRNLTKIALKLMVLNFVRTQELTGSKWDEFRYDENLWIIPAERM
ncbi:MAG: integrase arm-type DNA-binding domain-containing protein, partial [SAR324 cluster bacterium]|nr:integrase arm-type DNA-binding domain-containing protein [SAR324 cluster bacterium]